jgi:sugar transferase (PEP-CTERM/EpsH1 system associated)
MKILFVIPYVPNLVRVRSYNLIRSMKERGHQVQILTLWSGEKERWEVEELKGLGYQVEALPLATWRSLLNCLQSLPSSQPIQAAYCWQPELAHKSEVFLNGSNGKKGFDIIHVEHLRGARYGLHVRSLAQNGRHSSPQPPPVVWDSVDNITHLFRQAASKSQKRLSRWISRVEIGRTERFEGWLASQFARTLVTSANDKKAFTQMACFQGNPDRIRVLPNGVDLDYFTPGEHYEREPNTLVISGKMSYHANVSMVRNFVDRILPYIWQIHPEVRLWVVGKEPPAEIVALSKDPRITITGTVADIRPYLQKATVAVAPLTYGAGIQNKILEAMACATPVVSTPLGVSALQACEGRDIAVAQEPERFAQVVLGLLSDPYYRQQLAWNGRKYVDKHHQWSNIAVQLEGIYDEVIAEH